MNDPIERMVATEASLREQMAGAEIERDDARALAEEVTARLNRVAAQRDAARAEVERLRKLDVGILSAALEATERERDALMAELDGFHASEPAVEQAFRERDLAQWELADIKRRLGAVDGFDDGMGQVRRAEAAEEERQAARRERDAARAEVERLRRVNGEWGQVFQVLIDGLTERGVALPLGAHYTRSALAEIDRLTAERDDLRERADTLDREYADIMGREQDEHEARMVAETHYADLCRAVVLLADDTMLRAQWAASVSEPGDPAEVIAGIARRMLALVPDTPPDRPASADQSSTDGQQDGTETQEGTDG